MEAEINNEFQIFFSEESQSDSTIRCHLCGEVSAVDMEIRWFKETDCVCFYKNGRLIEGESFKGIMSLCIEELESGVVSLQLKDVRESYVGDYLCQVTSGDRTAEITIRKSIKTHEDQNEMSQQIPTLWTKQFEKIWTNEERIKMVNSALLAVFNSLEKTDLRKEDLQGINATVLQTDKNIEENQDETEEEDTQQENINRAKNESMSFLAMEMETSTCKPEEQETNPGNKISYLGNQQPGCSSQKLLDSDVNVCIFRSGKTKNHDKDFTDILQSRIEKLTEVQSVDQSDIILVFCPVVSQAGTDIAKALEIFNGKTETKLAVLVVLHHTFDPEKIVADSSKYIKRTDILTVDCLFYEDTGLLKCQKNSDSTDKTVNWLIQQGAKRGITLSPCQHKSSSVRHRFLPQAYTVGPPNQKSNVQEMTCNSSRPVDYFSHVTKNTYKCDEDFKDALHKLVPLRNVPRVQESDIILLFCPVCSPSDISATLQKYKRPDKPAVVIFLHKTLDSDSVPNSSGCVKSQDILVVDCIFCDGEGLPDCEKNREAISAVANWIKKFRDH